MTDEDARVPGDAPPRGRGHPDRRPGLLLRPVRWPEEARIVVDVNNAARLAAGSLSVMTVEGIRSFYDHLVNSDLADDLRLAEVDGRPWATSASSGATRTAATGSSVRALRDAGRPGGHLRGPARLDPGPPLEIATRRGRSTDRRAVVGTHLRRRRGRGRRPRVARLRSRPLRLRDAAGRLSTTSPTCRCRPGSRSARSSRPTCARSGRRRSRPSPATGAPARTTAPRTAGRSSWWIRSRDPTLWQVAWDGDEIVGMVRPFINAEENARFGVRRGWCENISTRAPWRGRGVASALISRALRALRERGMTEAALGVDAQNETGALRLYQAMGFREVSARRSGGARSSTSPGRHGERRGTPAGSPDRLGTPDRRAGGARRPRLGRRLAGRVRADGRRPRPGAGRRRAPRRLRGCARRDRRAPLEARATGRLRHEAGPAELPVVGDWVAVDARPDEGTASVHAVLPRRTQLRRRAPADYGAPFQVLAANVDIVLVATSLNRDLNARRVERFLATAWESGARPVVVLTKVDLAHDPVEVAVAEAQLEEVAVGVRVLATSALSGAGLDAVRAFLVPADRGARRLVRRRQEHPHQRAARRGSAPGPRDPGGRRPRPPHHRAAAARALPGGGLLLDTPGLRELGLWDDGAGLGLAFPDVTAAAEACRFTDCTGTSRSRAARSGRACRRNAACRPRRGLAQARPRGAPPRARDGRGRPPCRAARRWAAIGKAGAARSRAKRGEWGR